ncbi:MAG: exodeoxyribonuclease III [bacterium]|nr:exodeoxyribonuclease III [bacterium]
MQIISWNVNGLRAVYKKGALDPIYQIDPDIICLQETKSEKEQLPEELQKMSGYHAYFSSSQMRKGYSGVAIYSKIKPDKVITDLPFEKKEGRVIELHYDKMVLLNVYFPNGGGAPERLKYKLDFYDAFLEHIERLRKNGHSVIFCGDVNVAHEEIDIARPKENENHVGFLPEERAWVDELVYSGYIDIWRHLHPQKVQYSWWDMKSNARDRNVGWRIDYFFIGANLIKKVKKCEILGNIYDSDHCPVLLDVSL